jgi:hypothetical protein
MTPRCDRRVAGFIDPRHDSYESARLASDHEIWPDAALPAENAPYFPIDSRQRLGWTAPALVVINAALQFTASFARPSD